MNLFVYAAEIAYDKKMPDQACANGLQLHDLLQELQDIIGIGEKSYFSMNSIHNNTSHEMIW